MAEDNELKPEGRIWLLVILVLVCFGFALSYFSRINPDLADFEQSQLAYQGQTPTRQLRVYTVYYNTGVFSPTNIRIHVGDSVKFQNDSGGTVSVASDVTNGVEDLPGFSSISAVQPNGSFSYTFTTAGTFSYHSDKDEHGTVIVKP